MPDTDTSKNVLIIRPPKKWSSINFRELFEYRGLLYFLTWRNIIIKYKQTLLGIAWAVLQPLFMMIIFTIFFGNMAQVPSEGVPYPIFSYAGVLLWTYFSQAVTMSANSVISQTNLVTKIYFPRLLMPVAATASGILDYFIALVILVVMMIIYHVSPGPIMLLLPVLLFWSCVSATGVGMWLSALNVKYRDIRHIIPFLIQLWLFATPVIYPNTLLPEKYRWVISLNPIAGIIEAHRACILGHKPIDWLSLGISICVSSLIFATGLFYFKKMEKTFADII